ncbi:hypothetical protein RVR_8360 [Actinacidiphila reveromycinica]|uniref:Uncharacterized protein n=1 Tax=Actinacidiphila reveromycinica TaxID=659352 RepID=A0A7U3VRW3_9ACTN|nr:hypothetical protein [Streptomyces sp. SN-593]BBB01105.1 hypothetical protein RVR_8360 [Streptomyces sp. SN-593]
MANDRDSKQIDPDLMVRHPRSIETAGQVVIAAALEAPGLWLHHAMGWPWWIGAQLPVLYFMWQWSKERRFAHILASAFNQKVKAEREAQQHISARRIADDH